MARMRRWTAAGAAAVLVAWIAAGGVLAADQAVTIEGFAFRPATVTVQVGDSVVWRNQDSTAHTATAGDGSFNTESLGSGESSTITFVTAGTYAYACAIHPTMTGTVVVEAAAATPAAGGAGGAGGTPPPTDTLTSTSPDSDRDWGLVSATLAILGAMMLIGTLIADRRFHGRRHGE
jgi:plastocyanin